MRVRLPRSLAVLLAAAAILGSTACARDEPEADPSAVELADDVALDGTFASGGSWEIRAPRSWNGSLLLYSHAYVPPGTENPARLGPDEASTDELLREGYALAGSSYPQTGWAFADGVADQLSLLDLFAEEVGDPARTIAWGTSMGALMTVALLEQHPDRFDGGVAMCGVLAGSLPYWDQALDVHYGLRTLLAPDPAAQLVDITTDQTGPQARMRATVNAELATPLGEARVVLLAALAGLPGAADTDKLLLAQAVNLAVTASLGGPARVDLEERFGGNPSDNTAVDPQAILARSPRRAEVEAAYAAAGADIADDLRALADGPRVAADPAARGRLAAEYTPTGMLQDPLITLSTTGDPFAIPGNERVYADRVAGHGADDLLRSAITDREGHCTFLANEVVPVVEALHARVKLEHWPVLDARTLQGQARALGERLQQPIPPEFVDAELPTGAWFATERE